VQAGLTVTRTLRTRAPFAHRELLAFLALRAVPGVEHVEDATYHRTLALPGGPAIIAVTPRAASVRVTAALSEEADLPEALGAARRIFDLAADPAAIDGVLARDPLLAPLVAQRPGLRAPGSADGAELLVRAITGQQVSVAGARTTLGRISAAHGEPLAPALRTAALTHLFPSSARLAAADPAALGMPRARGAAIVGAAQACADGLRLEPGVDLVATRAQLLALRGVGPWTADYVAMRALGDRDAYLDGDLGVRHALAYLDGADPDRWRPYRSHGVHHLWAGGRFLSSL
jgi:AraC family transcriptional regulator of adaptative response / DNA-3-methyladenine glycosylase II